MNKIIASPSVKTGYNIINSFEPILYSIRQILNTKELVNMVKLDNCYFDLLNAQ